MATFLSSYTTDQSKACCSDFFTICYGGYTSHKHILFNPLLCELRVNSSSSPLLRQLP